jgi:hypothetical protein
MLLENLEKKTISDLMEMTEDQLLMELGLVALGEGYSPVTLSQFFYKGWDWMDVPIRWIEG